MVHGIDVLAHQRHGQGLCKFCVQYVTVIIAPKVKELLPVQILCNITRTGSIAIKYNLK